MENLANLHVEKMLPIDKLKVLSDFIKNSKWSEHDAFRVNEQFKMEFSSIQPLCVSLIYLTDIGVGTFEMNKYIRQNSGLVEEKLFLMYGMHLSELENYFKLLATKMAEQSHDKPKAFPSKDYSEAFNYISTLLAKIRDKKKILNIR